MEKNGKSLVFNIDEISLLDINELIDRGKRFRLEAGLEETEYDNIEECLNEL